MRLVEALRDALFGVDGGKVRATPRSVMGLPAITYAVQRISGNFAQLPFYPMRNLPNDQGAEKATEHRSYWPCKMRPNAYQTAYQFNETMATHALLWGNGRAAIVDRGREYLILNPDRTVTLMIDGEKYHATHPEKNERILQYASDVGISSARRDELLKGLLFEDPKGWVVLPDHMVLHLPGFGLSGLGGDPICELCRDALEIGLQNQKYTKKQFSEGFRGKIMLEDTKNRLAQDKDAKEFLDGFKTQMSGEDGSDVGLLRLGMTATVLNMSGRDAQWVENTNLQRQDAALMFLLESIVGDDTSVSYNSLEQKNLAFLVNCLNRFLVKWQQECWFKLLTKREQSEMFYKHHTAALLRSDFPSTMESLSKGIASTIYSPNEARHILDMNSREGGDEYGNPNTSSPNGNAEEQPAQDPPLVEDQSTQARAAIVSRLKHLIGVESKRVTNATSSANYLDWLDSFYARWCETILGDLGEDLALYHCNKSKDALIEASGKATKETLRATIADTVDNWKERAETLADRILECSE